MLVTMLCVTGIVIFNLSAEDSYKEAKSLKGTEKQECLDWAFKLKAKAFMCFVLSLISIYLGY